MSSGFVSDTYCLYTMQDASALWHRPLNAGILGMNWLMRIKLYPAKANAKASFLIVCFTDFLLR